MQRRVVECLSRPVMTVGNWRRAPCSSTRYAQRARRLATARARFAVHGTTAVSCTLELVLARTATCTTYGRPCPRIRQAVRLSCCHPWPDTGQTELRESLQRCSGGGSEPRSGQRLVAHDESGKDGGRVSRDGRLSQGGEGGLVGFFAFSCLLAACLLACLPACSIK